jgi:triacylglycerol lipase
VLVHGLLGFDVLQVGPIRLKNYFPGIEESLRRAGNRVCVVRLTPTAGVARRAEELRTTLNRELPHEPVHILAHSMGGLDARYMISRLGMEDRVRSLTTLGTPHRGSPYADWGIRHLRSFVKPLLRLFAMPEEGFYDLTTDACRARNDLVPDVPGVRYFSVAGRCSLAWVGLEWLVPHTVVQQSEGPNDGLVSVESATWGEHTDVWDGDHLSLINWLNPQACALGLWRTRDRHYLNMVRRLAGLGF